MGRFSSSSSSSSSPLLSFRRILIGLAVILFVYFSLQTSKSFNDNKSIPFEHVKTIVPSSRGFQSLDRPLKSNSFHPKSQKTIGGLAQEFEILWGDHRGKIHENGKLLTLSLDKYSGSGFQSKKEYLFGKIEIDIKLVPDDSAGTVTTFYMSSNTTNHDEIDFEFLGNVSGQPYTLHTNIYSQGKGSREQQFRLWFDPREDFHRYSILWNPTRIIFYVDGYPIREFKNMEDYGVNFPHDQPMRIFSSLWNADDWATQGGRVHTNWSTAPFIASFRDFSASACVWEYGSSSCGSNPSFDNDWIMEELDSNSLEKLKWVQENYMTYNYCNDEQRFQEEGLPKECTIKGIQRQ